MIEHIAVFVYRVQKYIGAYMAVLGGVDALIFTAGIGENSKDIRMRICKDLDHIGIYLNPKKNDKKIENARFIHHAGSKVKILVVKTDEEEEIARQTLNILQKKRIKT